MPPLEERGITKVLAEKIILLQSTEPLEPFVGKNPDQNKTLSSPILNGLQIGGGVRCGGSVGEIASRVGEGGSYI